MDHIQQFNPLRSTMAAKNFQRIFLLTLFSATFQSIQSYERHNAFVDLTPVADSFIGKVHVKESTYSLNLQPTSDTIFAPGFRLTETIRTDSGDVIYKDVTPRENLRALERSIYVDEEANAIFRMTESNGTRTMHGIMNNIHISHDGDDHFAIIHDWSDQNTKTDYLRTDLNLTKDPSADERAIAKAEPELYITVDYKLWEALKKDENKVLAYLAIMVRGVNNRYKTITDPEIRYKIVGSTVIKSRAAQPFVVPSKKVRGKYDQGDTLDEFSEYMLKQGKSIVKNDLAPLLSGELYEDSAGLAWHAGACRHEVRVRGKNGAIVELTYKTEVVQDPYGAFVGLHTFSHELAHNMGAPHDGNRPSLIQGYDTGDCPWSDGYIMSYEYNRKNRFTFSKCSQRTMKKYINTADGACVKEDQAPKADPPATQNPGEFVNLDQQCSNWFGIVVNGGCPTTVTVSKDVRTPDQLCSRLTCTCEGYEPVDLSVRPLDDSPCGNGGKCQEGRCV